MLLEVMLECHAWSTVRPKHESELSAQRLETQINAVMEVEKEQGRFPPPSRFHFVGRLEFPGMGFFFSVVSLYLLDVPKLTGFLFY